MFCAQFLVFFLFYVRATSSFLNFCSHNELEFNMCNTIYKRIFFWWVENFILKQFHSLFGLLRKIFSTQYPKKHMTNLYVYIWFGGNCRCFSICFSQTLSAFYKSFYFHFIRTHEHDFTQNHTVADGKCVKFVNVLYSNGLFWVNFPDVSEVEECLRIMRLLRKIIETITCSVRTLWTVTWLHFLTKCAYDRLMTS